MIYLKMPDGREYDVWHGYAAKYLIFKEPNQWSAIMQAEFIESYRWVKGKEELQEDDNWM